MEKSFLDIIKLGKLRCFFLEILHAYFRNWIFIKMQVNAVIYAVLFELFFRPDVDKNGFLRVKGGELLVISCAWCPWTRCKKFSLIIASVILGEFPRGVIQKTRFYIHCILLYFLGNSRWSNFQGYFELNKPHILSKLPDL